MSNNINIIFYSKKCKDCCNLLNILQNENMISYFRLFCVDDNMNKVPIEITYVPTMIVSTINKPLVGKEAFEWVTKAKFIRENTQKSLMKMMIENSGPLGWVDSEMNGISDSYAYKSIDKAMSHSFQGFKDEKSNIIFTAPNEEVIKINKKDQQKYLEHIKNNRINQDQDNIKVQKEQQYDILMKTEQANLHNNNKHHY